MFRKFTTACRLERPHTPLYPFGHGLSYSAFEYGPLILSKSLLCGDADALTAEIDVRNYGALVGDEVVQLYVGDPVASRSRPLRELKAFQRLTLQAAETRSVVFRITPADLRFDLATTLTTAETVCEPGAFRIEIGTNSQELHSGEIEWREA